MCQSTVEPRNPPSRLTVVTAIAREIARLTGTDLEGLIDRHLAGYKGDEDLDLYVRNCLQRDFSDGAIITCARITMMLAVITQGDVTTITAARVPAHEEPGGREGALPLDAHIASCKTEERRPPCDPPPFPPTLPPEDRS